MWRNAEFQRLDLRACSQRRIPNEVRDAVGRALATGCREFVVELRDDDELDGYVIDALGECAQSLQARGARLVVRRHAPPADNAKQTAAELPKPRAPQPEWPTKWVA